MKSCGDTLILWPKENRSGLDCYIVVLDSASMTVVYPFHAFMHKNYLGLAGHLGEASQEVLSMRTARTTKHIEVQAQDQWQDLGTMGVT
jgi:hypothetical protein